MSIVVQLELVTPEALMLSETTLLVTAPGIEGYFGVMAGHAPFITLLQAGVLTVGDQSSTDKQQPDDIKQFVIAGGYAEVLPDKVTILTERAIAREQITKEQIQQEKSEAQEHLTSLADKDPLTTYWQTRMDFANICQELISKPSS